MIDYSNLVIRPLDSAHNKLGFDSGSEPLNIYLNKQANQDIKRRISRVFIAASAAEPNDILGFYTLSSLSIELNQLPTDLARKLPRHPIPAALLGSLAVSRAHQGYGIGKMLLVDAIKRTLEVSSEIAIYAMVVDAKDEQTGNFYVKYGFSSLTEDNRRLFLPLKSL